MSGAKGRKTPKGTPKGPGEGLPYRRGGPLQEGGGRGGGGRSGANEANGFPGGGGTRGLPEGCGVGGEVGEESRGPDKAAGDPGSGRTTDRTDAAAAADGCNGRDPPRRSDGKQSHGSYGVADD